MSSETVADAVVLAALRESLDSVDEAIARLLAARRQLSQKAQLHKLRVGRPRIDAAREAHIVEFYDRVAPGSRPVAEVMLRYCRGPEVGI